MLKKFEITAIAIALSAVFFTAGFFIGREYGSSKIYIDSSIQRSVPIEISEEIAPSEYENDGRIDINTADKNALQTLPGIGETLAERIIEYRAENGAFSAPDDIMNVEGIGEAKYTAIKDLIAAG